MKTLKKYAKAELRFVDTLVAPFTQNNTATLTLLNGVAQGDDANSREGSMVWNKTFSMIYSVTPNGAYVSNGGAQTRLMVVYDRQTNGAAFSMSDLLTATNDPIALRFWYSRSRYKVLYDKVLDTYFNGPLPVHRVVKKINLPTKYGTATTGTVSNMSKGSLYLVTVSNVASNGPTVHAHCRVSFMP